MEEKREAFKVVDRRSSSDANDKLIVPERQRVAMEQAGMDVTNVVTTKPVPRDFDGKLAEAVLGSLAVAIESPAKAVEMLYGATEVKPTSSLKLGAGVDHIMCHRCGGFASFRGGVQGERITCLPPLGEACWCQTPLIHAKHVTEVARIESVTFEREERSRLPFPHGDAPPITTAHNGVLEMKNEAMQNSPEMHHFKDEWEKLKEQAPADPRALYSVWPADTVEQLKAQPEPEWQHIEGGGVAGRVFNGIDAMNDAVDASLRAMYPVTPIPPAYARTIDERLAFNDHLDGRPLTVNEGPNRHQRRALRRQAQRDLSAARRKTEKAKVSAALAKKEHGALFLEAPPTSFDGLPDGSWWWSTTSTLKRRVTLTRLPDGRVMTTQDD